ncbi:MAG: ribonuclease III [Oscillospiraceae bacterium]|nr:ribonuclease III [Oscillospiraceae bacterium]
MNLFEEKIKYCFKDKTLLKTALTHSSYNNEERKSRRNNERLEFLGDSVISLIVTEHLYKIFSDKTEGELTKIRASLVCDHSLVEFAKKIDLGNFLFMGKGEEHSGGRNRPSNLEDAFEALVGAIYLDGGIKCARKFIMRFVPENIDMSQIDRLRDYKTQLQEIIQQNPEEKIQYVLISESGPDHNKRFETEVHLNSNVIGKGIGKSKKQSEQNAAKQALYLMGL